MQNQLKIDNEHFITLELENRGAKKQCYIDKAILDSQPTQFHDETTRETLKNHFESYVNVVVETCVETR